MSFVILVVVVVVVDTLSWLMDWIFFINVHLHRFVIEKCSPNLIPNIVTLPHSPTPPLQIIILVVLCIWMGLMNEHSPLHFPWKANTVTSYTLGLFLCTCHVLFVPSFWIVGYSLKTHCTDFHIHFLFFSLHWWFSDMRSACSTIFGS